MSDFMQLTTYKKGALYCADCAKCGATMYSHEWGHCDNNEMRDALENGTAHCADCGGRADPDTFQSLGRQYACHYSAPGYMDQTDYMYGKNRRVLEREVKQMFGDY